MIWLFTLPFLLLVVVVALRLPYGAFRIARRNAYRGTGERSEGRTQREMRRLGALLWRTLGAPLLILLALGGGMRAFHLYAMPEDSLARIFGEYHPEESLHAPDLEAWEEALEAAQRERAYEAWQQAQGLAPRTERSLGDQFAEHWPVHLVFLLLLFAFVLWYVLWVVPSVVTAYRDGVLTRSKQYVHRDLAAALD